MKCVFFTEFVYHWFFLERNPAKKEGSLYFEVSQRTGLETAFPLLKKSRNKNFFAKSSTKNWNNIDSQPAVAMSKIRFICAEILFWRKNAVMPRDRKKQSFRRVDGGQ